MGSSNSEFGFDAHMFICGHGRENGNSKGCCSSKGSLDVLIQLKKMAKDAGLDGVRIQKSGCLDACSKGPVAVIYPKGEWIRLPTDESECGNLIEYLAGREQLSKVMRLG